MIYSSLEMRAGEINRESLIRDAVKSSNLRTLQTSTCRTFHGVNIRAVCARKRDWLDYRRFRCTVANVKIADRQVRRSVNLGKTACTERSREPFSVIAFASRPNYSSLPSWHRRKSSMNGSAREGHAEDRRAEAEGKFMGAHSAPVR